VLPALCLHKLSGCHHACLQHKAPLAQCKQQQQQRLLAGCPGVVVVVADPQLYMLDAS
jgi:hypothetical protein